MSRRNVLTIRVPEELKQRIDKYSRLQGVSVNQFALYAFTKELGELETNEYFQRYLKETNIETLKEDVRSILGKIKSRPVPEWDELSQ